MRIFAVLVIALATTALNADDKQDKTPPDIAEFLKITAEEKERETERIIKEIKSESQRIKTTANRTQRARLKKRLANYKQYLKSLRDKDNFVVPVFKKLDVGSIGRPFDNHILITQVVNDNEAIIELKQRTGYEVVNNMVTGIPIYVSYTLWLKGVSMKGQADNRGITYKEPLIITRNKSYETVTGAKKTLMVLEPYDVNRVKDYLKEQRSQPKNKATD